MLYGRRRQTAAHGPNPTCPTGKHGNRCVRQTAFQIFDHFQAQNLCIVQLLVQKHYLSTESQLQSGFGFIGTVVHMQSFRCTMEKVLIVAVAPETCYIKVFWQITDCQV